MWHGGENHRTVHTSHPKYMLLILCKPFTSLFVVQRSVHYSTRQLTTMAKLDISSTLPLPSSSITIPRLGFGVYQSPEDVCKRSCSTALKSGYRHIDTAQFYANEQQVGDAVRESGLNRSDVYITTKILSAGGSVDKSYAKCVESVKKIAGDGEDAYVDLFLIHSPNAGKAAREEMWKALLKLHEEGKAKAIGVSNFGKGHIESLKSLGSVWPPHVNQIEVSSLMVMLP